MVLLFDGLAGVIAPGVGRDFLVGSDDQSHRRRRGDQGERLLPMRMGDRVVIPIEVHRGRFGRGDDPRHGGVEGMRGQREEARLLLREDLRDPGARDGGAGVRSRRASAETTR